MTTFVLVHSPLVGPATWSGVAAALEERDLGFLRPALHGDDLPAGVAYWQQHAGTVATALDSLPADAAVVLVGHSGAGPLLPAIRQLAGRPVAAYLFVDAGIPEDGMSRLELLRAELPEMAEELQGRLEAGGRFPEWAEDDLAAVLPDQAMLRAVLDEMHPRPPAFWTEPLPVFARWPDAPCAYLQLSAGYAAPAARARALGWAYDAIDAGHFHQLVDPAAVVGVMLDLLHRAGVEIEAEEAQP